MNTTTPPASAEMRRLMSLINGYRATQAIHVAVLLGIPELVAERPRHGEDLAVTTQTHPASLLRLLRTLKALDLLREDADGWFSATPSGQLLTSASSKSLRAWAHLMGSGRMWAAWGGLLQAIRSGQSAFQQIHGASVWDVRRAHDDDGRLFSLAMREATHNLAAEILTNVDFSGSSHVIDIGGGDGTLISRILGEWQHLRATLFDLPYAIENLDPMTLSDCAADRVEVISGDFFSGIPHGGDTYILKHVLHDWSDPEAEKILRQCRTAIEGSGRLLIIERLLGHDNESLEANLADLHMMVVTGGRERSHDEMMSLLQRCGFTVAKITQLSAGRFVVEAGS